MKNSEKLKRLQDYGLMPKSTKSFTKKAKAIFTELPGKFTRESIPPGVNFMKVSPEAAKAFESVNMTVFHGHVIYPTHPKSTVKIKETKHGVFLVDTNNFGTKTEIILSKKGDHIAYAKQLEKRHPGSHAYGTLKEANYNTKQGAVNGWLRDTSKLYQNIPDAIEDNRYEVDKSNHGTNTAVTAVIRLTF